jgi:hypothetical protein
VDAPELRRTGEAMDKDSSDVMAGRHDWLRAGAVSLEP